MGHRRHRTIHLGIILLVGLLLLSLGAAAPVALAQSGPPPTDHTITSHDGTPIAATLYRSTTGADEPRPGILTTHGWGADRSSLAAHARWLNEQGYHVLAYDSRGFGESGGTVEMNGPNEVADVTALIDWWVHHANTSREYNVILDAPGDPRLGMVGGSYGGAIQLLAAAHDTRIDAIVPDITWHDLEESLAPDGVVKRGWVDFLFWSGTLGAHGVLGASPDGNPDGGLDPRLRDWYLQAMLTGRLPSEAHEPLAERSPRTVIDDIQADVFLLQGWSDTLFDPDQAFANHAALAKRDGPTTQLLIHDGGHSSALSRDADEAIRTEVAAFFSRHLDDVPLEPAPAVQFIDPRTKAWFNATPWLPPETTTYPLGSPDGAAQVVLAQTAAPSTHTEQQALSPILDPRNADAPIPTSVILDTGLTGPVTIVGRPTLVLNVTGDVADTTLFASLSIRGPDGTHQVLNDQVAAARLVPSVGDPQLVLDMVSLYHTVPFGHTLHLRLATSDSAYHGARDTGTVTLELADATLTLPLLAREDIRDAAPTAEDEPDTSKDAPATPSALVIAALAALALTARRRRARN